MAMVAIDVYHLSGGSEGGVRQLRGDNLALVASRRLLRQLRRVGPVNFTPSLSQIRTGYSRIIRLVPSREGCRLPLNEGLLPANQLAQISGDDPPPSLQPPLRGLRRYYEAVR